MSQENTLLELVKNGATAEPWGNNGVHIKIGEKNLWTDHTNHGIDIWTNSVNDERSSRAIIELSMIDVLITELRIRVQKQELK
jgi:hypothetical protein